MNALRMRAQLPQLRGTFARERFVLRFGDGTTKEELLQMGKYSYIDDAAEKFVRSTQFRMSGFGEREFAIIDFNNYATSQEIFDFFLANGLEEPTEEDALRFALQFPPKSMDRPLVFLHVNNFWLFRSGMLEELQPHVLVVGTTQLKKALYCRALPGGRDHSENSWPTNYRFVARKLRSRK